MSAAVPKSIFLVDDHPLIREGLVRSIEEVGDWQITGSAENYLDAIAAIERHSPDLLIADISLPGKNGLELIKDVRSRFPGLKILVYSMHDEMIYAERVMRAGAKGYLTKGEPPDTLVQAIRTVLEGGIYLSPRASTKLLENFSGNKARGQLGVNRLSDRELEIFELIGQGMIGSQISQQLHISTKTVDAHRANIRSKLGLADAASLLRAAVLWKATSDS